MDSNRGLFHYGERHRLYGAIMDMRAREEESRQAIGKKRRRLEILSLLLAVLLPWLVFVTTYGITAFYVHYAAPLFTLIFECALLGVCVSLWISACKNPGLKWGFPHVDEVQQFFYPLYFAVAVSLAAVIGTVTGDYNFWNVMEPVYETEHLATYMDVDPSQQQVPWLDAALPANGGRYADAGTLGFANNTVVDTPRYTSLSAAGDTYCVAPIIDPSCTQSCGNDFWAVGMNCCGGGFSCGDVFDPHAHSGLRLTDITQRSLFRLAVLKAEGMHHVLSRHPIFVYWTLSPMSQLRSWRHTAYKRFTIGMVGSAFGSAALLVAACKLVRSRLVLD